MSRQDRVWTGGGALMMRMWRGCTLVTWAGLTLAQVAAEFATSFTTVQGELRRRGYARWRGGSHARSKQTGT